MTKVLKKGKGCKCYSCGSKISVNGNQLVNSCVRCGVHYCKRCAPDYMLASNYKKFIPKIDFQSTNLTLNYVYYNSNHYNKCKVCPPEIVLTNAKNLIKKNKEMGNLFIKNKQ